LNKEEGRFMNENQCSPYPEKLWGQSLCPERCFDQLYGSGESGGEWAVACDEVVDKIMDCRVVWRHFRQLLVLSRPFSQILAARGQQQSDMAASAESSARDVGGN
jgi:hypothetical protein